MKEKFVSTIAMTLMLGTTFASAEDGSWADTMKIKGDLRGRYESVEKDGETSKSRLRLRARAGVYADVNEQVRAGIRLATGSDESPTSTNQSIEDFGNKRDVWVDLMYMGYSPDAIEGLDVVLGRMKKPWEAVSDLVFDGDVNPEGLNLNFETDGDVTLTANVGYFLWEDTVGGDPETDVTMFAGQLAAKVSLSEAVALSVGANAFLYDNIEDAEIPSAKGNTEGTTVDEMGETVGDGSLVYGFELVEGFAKVDLKNDVLPIKLYVDYVVNTASDVEEDTALLYGIGTKIDKLSFDYNYRDIDADAVVGLFTDSDFAGGGAGGKGHKFKAKYKLLDNWTAGVTYFLAENGKGEDVDTLQADLVVKF